MKIKTGNILWGIAFIIMGILFAGKAFYNWDINIFSLAFRFWPLIIILSNVSGLIKKGFNISSLSWVVIGVILLLLTNGILSGGMIRSLIFPVGLILIGISLIFKDSFPTKKIINKLSQNVDSSSPEYTATFSSTNYRYPHDIFTGATINSIFGSVVLDLRDAIITEDVVINSTSIFAGVDIIVPSNVNVKVSSVPIFGGVSNKAMNPTISSVTLYINATCMFGGVDIK
jgi:predicted membrane protein